MSEENIIENVEDKLPKGWPKYTKEKALKIFELDQLLGSPFRAIVYGKYADVGEEKLHEAARHAIALDMEQEKYASAFRLAKNLFESSDYNYGHITQEDINELEKLYLAQKLEEESEEKKKMEKNKDLRKTREPKILVDADTTFKDLFKQLDELEEIFGEDEIPFAEELYDNIDDKIAEDILVNMEDGKRNKTKVLEYFEKKRNFNRRN